MSLCACFKEVGDGLKEKNLKLSDRCFQFNVTGDLRMDLNFYIPLERLDGKRPARNDPKAMRVSHCPFCGAPVKLKGEAEPSVPASTPEAA